MLHSQVHVVQLTRIHLICGPVVRKTSRGHTNYHHLKSQCETTEGRLELAIPDHRQDHPRRRTEGSIHVDLGSGGVVGIGVIEGGWFGRIDDYHLACFRRGVPALMLGLMLQVGGVESASSAGRVSSMPRIG